jgi:uncharacterized NAD(P)/FAD-binding protein YdhS
MKLELKERILFNLLSHGYVGKKHTPLVNACKGFPKHEVDQVKGEIHNLVTGGYLVLKPTGHGLDVSINPQRLSEIKKLPGMRKIIEMNPYIKGRFNF